MDPSKVFCHNPDCPARGKTDCGNIGIHSRKERRYICHVCGKTFTESKGTVFYRLRYPSDFVVQMITLLAYGCPVPAIVAAFSLDERTVASWQRRSGNHCQQIHEHLVQQPRDLGQVQADEIRVKHQGGIAWLCMALQVSTRLWLGGVVSAHRDGKLVTHLIEQVRRCALYRRLLFCVDGFSAYVSSIQKVFRTPIFTNKRGRPHLRAWEHVCIVQVIKQVSRRRVVGVIHRIAGGTSEQVKMLLKQTQNTIQPHVAYIERLNGTFRSRITALIRRGRSLARQLTTLQQSTYLVGTVYNFCEPHQSLRKRLHLPNNRKRWVQRTPAIAAGITDHIWTMQELFSYQVPLPPWEPPKRRGRPSRQTRELIERWIL
jgi:transposase-like protein